MTTNGDEVEHLRLLAAAREFLERVVAAIRYSELFDDTYAVSSRLKKATRLSEKIAAKQAEGRAEYGLSDVTDIVGIRFISLYRRDVAEYVRTVLEMIVGDRQLNPNPLEGVDLVEIKSFVSSGLPDQDPLNLELGALFESDFADRLGGVKFEPIARSRYSSVHMVLKARYRHEDREHTIPIELQFRSVFEDAWGEIDHMLLYEMGRHGERVDEGQREVMAQHMSVLKKMVDAVADYADVIRRTVAVSRDKPASIERNLDDAGYMRELAALAGLPQQLADELTTVLKEKIGLDEKIAAGRPDITALQYIDVANKLRLLSPAVEGSLGARPTKPAKTVLFSLRMEEALCRLLSGDPQQIRVSVEAYSGLTRDFPEFPAGWFRSAQANQRLSDVGDPAGSVEAAAAETAFQHYSEALRQLDRCVKMRPGERILFISPQQVNYIGTNAGRLQGFVKWRLSDRRRMASGTETQQDLDDVLLAFDASKAALGRERSKIDRLKLVNNVVFYAAEAHMLGSRLGQIDKLPHIVAVRPLLTELEANSGNSVLRLDTIVRGNIVVGDQIGAKRAARRILDINAGAPGSGYDPMSSPYVNEAKDRAARHAWKVVRDEDEKDA